ncbi:unnamed protein product [Lactuca virosa]|uniref:Uncharacterized protein n=1 Tax=Lactuca virosa TaxID=75947 RepID=A0AAU9LUD9_9ASTR|nr:unnamed protein product [Lactuca virosa]
MYYGAIYKNTYKYPMRGMNGSNMWPPTEFIAHFPPLKKKMPGSSGKKAKDGKDEHVTDEQRSKGNKGINGNVGEGSSGKKAKDGKDEHVTDEQRSKGNKGINGNVGEGSSGKKAKDGKDEHVTDEQGIKGNKGINGNVREGSSGKKAMDGKDEKGGRGKKVIIKKRKKSERICWISV